MPGTAAVRAGVLGEGPDGAEGESGAGAVVLEPLGTVCTSAFGIPPPHEASAKTVPASTPYRRVPVARRRLLSTPGRLRA